MQITRAAVWFGAAAECVLQGTRSGQGLSLYLAHRGECKGLGNKDFCGVKA